MTVSPRPGGVVSGQHNPFEGCPDHAGRANQKEMEMRRGIVVFERGGNGNPILDFRLIRGALPMGSCPLAIADRDGFAITEGQYFGKDEVALFAERESGFDSSQCFRE